MALPGGAPAPASTPVTKILRPPLERMISFSTSMTRQNTGPACEQGRPAESSLAFLARRGPLESPAPVLNNYDKSR
jgi:hypothetical protein